LVDISVVYSEVNMKRKVIKQGPATLMVSLPSKWVKQYGVKKGDEVDVEEKGSNLDIKTQKESKEKKIEVDISGLDRTSLMLRVRSAYRLGFDEIKVVFEEAITRHFRTGEEKKVIAIIHKEVNRLVGVEVVEEKENYCIIKDYSASVIEEFDNVVRRLFRLIKDTCNEIYHSLESENFKSLNVVEERHDTITKFVSYCLRLLTKRGYQDNKKDCLLYHIISSLDSITDIMKYISRDFLDSKWKIKKEVLHIIKKINESIDSYYDIFYDFSNEKIYKLNKNRDDVKIHIKREAKKFSDNELLLLDYYRQILEIIWDLTLARMGLEF